MKIHAATFVRLTIAAGFLCLAVAFTAAPAAPLAQSGLNGDRSPDTSDPAAGTGKWKKQEGIPTPWGLYDVDMISATEGWAVTHPLPAITPIFFTPPMGGKSGSTRAVFSASLAVSLLPTRCTGWPWLTSIDLGRWWQNLAAEQPGRRQLLRYRSSGSKYRICLRFWRCEENHRRRAQLGFATDPPIR